MPLSLGRSTLLSIEGLQNIVSYFKISCSQRLFFLKWEVCYSCLDQQYIQTDKPHVSSQGPEKLCNHVSFKTQTRPNTLNDSNLHCVQQLNVANFLHCTLNKYDKNVISLHFETDPMKAALTLTFNVKFTVGGGGICLQM